MSEPRAERDEATGATRYGEGDAGRPLHHDHLGHEHDHELTTSGVDVDEQLDESVDENLRHGRHADHHRLGEAEEDEHELTTMGVDVDAALDRAVDENR